MAIPITVGEVNKAAAAFNRNPNGWIFFILVGAVVGLSIGMLRLNDEKNEVIAQKDAQIIQCKNEFAAKVEFLLMQSDAQRQNLMARQSILIEKVDYLTKTIESKKR
jgi:hypothetical protein